MSNKDFEVVITKDEKTGVETSKVVMKPTTKKKKLTKKTSEVEK